MNTYTMIINGKNQVIEANNQEEAIKKSLELSKEKKVIEEVKKEIPTPPKVEDKTINNINI